MKKIALLLLIIASCFVSVGNVGAVTVIPNSDNSYETGRNVGTILGALFVRNHNRSPHIDIGKNYTFLASNTNSLACSDMSSVKSLRKSDPVFIIQVSNFMNKYDEGIIVKYTVNYYFDNSTQTVQWSMANIETYDYKGNLKQKIETPANPPIQTIDPQSDLNAAIANTAFMKLYKVPFYTTIKVPILSQDVQLIS
jgi:hypothetical protein